MEDIAKLKDSLESTPHTTTGTKIEDQSGNEAAAEEILASHQPTTTINHLIEKDTTDAEDIMHTPNTTEDSRQEVVEQSSNYHKANHSAAHGTDTASDCPSSSPSTVQGSVASFFKHKNVLLTGVTGFIGKAILWKLIETVKEDIGNIYVLIRSGNVKRSKLGRPSDRLKNEVINNKAFQILRHSIGLETFDRIVKNKIIPVSGDLISPDLSISSADKDEIIKNVQVVIHCAATLHFTERLDLALETNTLGTLRMMDLADECENMERFVYMSPAYIDPNIPDGHIQERVYPMPIGDPEELLSQIIDLELQDIPKMTERILAHYPNTYTFTKALTEHLILKRVDINRIEEMQGGKVQWPIAIVKATQVGAGAFEPLPGWLDGVTGANGTIFLMSKGIQALQPGVNKSLADIVPVDFVVRITLGVCASISAPGCQFVLPYEERLKEVEQPIKHSDICYFPYIYQISACAIDETTWYNVYDSVRYYWNRNTSLLAPSNDSTANTLPKPSSYFTASRPLFKPKLLSRYGSLSRSLSTLTSPISGTDGSNSANNASSNRLLDAASRVVEAMQPFLSHHWIFDHQNVQTIEQRMHTETQFNVNSFRHLDWHTYITNFTYGVHSCIMPEPPLSLRNITVPEGWACGLYLHPGAAHHSIIDQQIESVIFSASDIRKRTDRMLIELVASIEKPDHNLSKDKKRLEQWIDDFDASLDDWCHDDSNILKNKDDMTHLGHWRNITSSTDVTYDEHFRIEVLNDPRVGQSIKQIVESSGVPQNTVVGEALKIYQRMKERTQLPYVWSAGTFLNALFKRLFTSLRLNALDIARLKEQIKGKKVVYIPASKTIIDQLIVWYICLRYKLPVPAIVCDEALALLGPISDILRIAGALFIRRDTQSRSPLNSAVASAYITLLLKRHGALSMVVERARSRTGRLQPAYDDGLMKMVIEATMNQQQKHNSLSTPSDSESETRTVMVPINITYEKIPELKTIVDQVLQQRPQDVTSQTINYLYDHSRSTASSESSLKKSSEKTNSQYGRVFVGFGDVMDIEESLQQVDMEQESNDRSLSLSDAPSIDRNIPIDKLTHMVQRGQHSAMIISPVTLVAATLLFGRVTNGITIGKLHRLVVWFREKLIEKQVPIDWQYDEDVVTVVSYAFQLLNANEALIVDDKRMTEHTIIRVVEDANNIMKLSYMSSQLIELLLPEAIFSVVYLSMKNGSCTKEGLRTEFKFLARLLQHEFVFPWDRNERFNSLFELFVKERLFVVSEDGHYQKTISIDTDEVKFTQICVLASLLYPTLDAYWVTSCSLSALRDLTFMPRKTVPVLSQWIAAHLIAGRRTIYREVLSVEASQNAIDNFLALGLIYAVHPKTKLSPDAQILLLELGVTTNDDLVLVANEVGDEEGSSGNKSAEHAIKTEEFKDIASLCHKIEQYRLASDNGQLPHNHNAQVFDKCQNQIRSILKADQTYASQRGMKLDIKEDQMIQLVYALKAASDAAPVSQKNLEKQSRRVSQAYNLNSSE